jgi:hypothetical protein
VVSYDIKLFAWGLEIERNVRVSDPFISIQNHLILGWIILPNEYHFHFVIFSVRVDLYYLKENLLLNKNINIKFSSHDTFLE